MNFPNIEEAVLKKWRAEKTFQKSLEKRKKGPLFVFYDGPPTANAGPGLHHMINRVMKDVILRYKTMQGFFVPRKAGWDTHGLPVELQIEKKLGLKSKKDIEQYGIARFNEECRRSVWEYKGEWEKFQERIGLWIDMDNPYITYNPRYIESLWFVIKQFWNKKLFYKDYKVVPYCSRCGTPLSSHELAQGYKTVQDRAVYVKFKALDNPIAQDAYFLAWTTTLWTLPANVALAVNAEKPYVLAEQNGERYILAENLASKILGEHKKLKVFQGKELLGTKYEPLFRFQEPEKGKKIWEVVHADFVSVEDGTGVAHEAIAYGEDDFALGKKENIAMLHVVNEEGKFIDAVGPWKGMFVRDADPLIIEDLKKRELLYKEELHSHEYPFCWRCSTPLLYYAKETWFLNMQKVKSRLLENNKRINWIPSHIKEGRMGEWLKDVKDWAFSRERYWGTPLPVWNCVQCGHTEVIGSLEDLKRQKFTTNSYYILRHGHSERQETDVMASWPEKIPHALTAKGKKQIAKLAKTLKKKKINAIFSSDLLRTKQTAEIIGKELGLDVMFDARLREWDMGSLNGKHVSELGKAWGRAEESGFEHYMRRFRESVPGGESWQDVQKRMYEFLKDLDAKYDAKNILIVSHETPFTMLEGMVQGFTREQVIEYRQKKKKYIHPGELRQLPFAILPYNESMELDLHRPYVDGVAFLCPQCKTGKMKRVQEVVDVWFDSGAMPFAQDHWPFEGKQSKKLIQPKLFPAEYIVEGIDQTRGWFYTLLAVSTLLGFKNPYKNVISLGHVLDEKGEKMSKSKGNIVSPWDIAQKYGVDASRWYFYTINNPGDSKLFAEKDIQEAVRKFLLTFWNCFVFFDTYAHKAKSPLGKPSHVLDMWILSRVQNAVQSVRKYLDEYDITKAARALEDFIVNDLSLWYVRRSRSRFQNPKDQKDFVQASTVLHHALETAATLLSPFIPFLTEHIFLALNGTGSVHLQDWPKVQNKMKNAKLEQEMERARDIVAKALAERARAGIKVRQPLAQLAIKSKAKFSAGVASLIQEEVNVKEIVYEENLAQDVKLDTTITAQLKEEGMTREIMRKIQEMRKEAGYRPKDRTFLQYAGDNALCVLLEMRREDFKKALGIANIGKGIQEKSVFDIQAEVVLDGKALRLAIKKVS